MIILTKFLLSLSLPLVSGHRRRVGSAFLHRMSVFVFDWGIQLASLYCLMLCACVPLSPIFMLDFVLSVYFSSFHYHHDNAQHSYSLAQVTL